MVPWCMGRTIMDRAACFVFVRLYDSPAQRRAAGFRRSAMTLYVLRGHARGVKRRNHGGPNREPRSAPRPEAEPNPPVSRPCAVTVSCGVCKV